MDELNIYYHVVPTNDGCTFLCLDSHSKKLYLRNKSKGDDSDSLIFSSERAAEEWIEFSPFPKGHFKAEWFATTDVIDQFSDMG